MPRLFWLVPELPAPLQTSPALAMRVILEVGPFWGIFEISELPVSWCSSIHRSPDGQ